MGRKIINRPFYYVVYFSFIIFVISPLVYVLITIFFEKNPNENYSILVSTNTLLLLFNSIAIAFIVGLLSTFFGTVLGFLLYKTKIAFSGFFLIALLIPLFLSPYIFAVAWKDLFLILFGSSSFISSYTGLIIVLTTIYTPLSMMITGSALANINSQMEESGLVITNFRSMVLKIIVPLIKPALLTSFVLVFIFSISEFSVASLFGLRVFTTEIFTQFSAFYNHSLAILQSALLVVICILLLSSERKYISDAPFLSIDSRGTNNKKYFMKKYGLLAQVFLYFWFSISVVFPFLVLSIQSFNDGTARFFQAFKLLLPTFGNSAGLASVGAVLIVLVGFVSAYYSLNRKQKIFSFDNLLLLVFAIPSTVFGISLIKFYNNPGLDFIYSGFAIVLIAWVGKFSFIASKIIGNAIRQIPKSLDEAAQIEGVTFFNRQIKILLPLILPSLFAAFVIGFIFSLGELSTTIMVYPPGSELMPIKVFTIMANAPQSLTSSMSLIVFSLTLVLISGFVFMVKPLVKKYSSNND